MLDKLAELVREMNTIDFPEHPCLCNCQYYYEGCHKECKEPGFLELARWAVLLVAKGLGSWEEYQKAGIEYAEAIKKSEEASKRDYAFSDFLYAEESAYIRWTELDAMVTTELHDLIAEAKEGE